jgi:hypothetical protein
MAVDIMRAELLAAARKGDNELVASLLSSNRVHDVNVTAEVSLISPSTQQLDEARLLEFKSISRSHGGPTRIYVATVCLCYKRTGRC